jgi:hypothetical protein
MCLFLEIVRRMEKKFKGFTFIHIPRTENSEADSPAKQASLNTPSNPDVFHDTKATPAISGDGSRDISNIEVIDCRQPLEEYLNGTFELTDTEEKRRSRVTSTKPVYVPLSPLHHPGARQRPPTRPSW